MAYLLVILLYKVRRNINVYELFLSLQLSHCANSKSNKDYSLYFVSQPNHLPLLLITMNPYAPVPPVPVFIPIDSLVNAITQMHTFIANLQPDAAAHRRIARGQIDTLSKLSEALMALLGPVTKSIDEQTRRYHDIETCLIRIQICQEEQTKTVADLASQSALRGGMQQNNDKKTGHTHKKQQRRDSSHRGRNTPMGHKSSAGKESKENDTYAHTY